jgi:hypothetical protein
MQETQNWLTFIINFVRCMENKHTMSDAVVGRWMRHFNEGHENVHDDPQNGRPSVVNEDLVCAAEEKIQENRRFTICHFPCIFHKFHDHFFTKLCMINFVFGNCVHAGEEAGNAGNEHESVECEQ